MYFNAVFLSESAPKAGKPCRQQRYFTWTQDCNLSVSHFSIFISLTIFCELQYKGCLWMWIFVKLKLEDFFVTWINWGDRSFKNCAWNLCNSLTWYFWGGTKFREDKRMLVFARIVIIEKITISILISEFVSRYWDTWTFYTYLVIGSYGLDKKICPISRYQCIVSSLKHWR